jgi:hypothetical protein
MKKSEAYWSRKAKKMIKNLFLKVQNPVWISASHLTENIKSIEECCRRGVGGIVLKCTDGRSVQPCARNCQKCQFPSSFGGRKLFAKNLTLYSFTPDSLSCEFLSLEEVRSFLNFLKEKYPDVIRIANIFSPNPEKFIKIAKKLKEMGAQILELNSKYIVRYKDAKTNDNQQYLLNFIGEITPKINLPIIIKIYPDFGLLGEEFIKKVSQYDIAGLTITNSLPGILPSYFRKKLPKGIKKKTCAIVGEPLWRLVKKYVPIAKSYVNFVAASGGIYNTKRAREIIKLGADVIQLCSGIEFFGYNLINDIKLTLTPSKVKGG